MKIVFLLIATIITSSAPVYGNDLCFSVISTDENNNDLPKYLLNRINNKFGTDACGISSSFHSIDLVVSSEDEKYSGVLFYSNSYMLKNDLESEWLPSIDVDCSNNDSCIDTFVEKLFKKIESIKEIHDIK